MTGWVGYLEDHPTYRNFLVIGVISHFFIYLFSLIYLFICLFIFIFINLFVYLFIYLYAEYIYMFVYRIQTLDLRLPNHSPVMLRWMILQNFPLGSDISPGREKPTAGADVLAARRGTAACCRARLHAQFKPFRLIFIYVLFHKGYVITRSFPHKSHALIG